MNQDITLEQIKEITIELIGYTDYYYYGKDKMYISINKEDIRLKRTEYTSNREMLYDMAQNYQQYQLNPTLELYIEELCYLELDNTLEEMEEWYNTSKNIFDFMNRIFNEWGIIQTDIDLVIEELRDY